jgi:hypothetical protein
MDILTIFVRPVALGLLGVLIFELITRRSSKKIRE